MISRLRGKLLEVKNGEAIIDVNGVGYGVKVPATFFSSLCSDVNLFIDTVVREDSITLFGFETSAEKDLFKLLYSVSGIGPKTALAIISFYSVNDLHRIISNRDINLLSKVSGVGKKTAERIIVELKEKIGAYSDNIEIKCAGPVNLYEDLIQALVGFGYKRNEAVDALRNRKDDIETGQPIEKILRETLREMSR